jgi:hypothetical protein
MTVATYDQFRHDPFYAAYGYPRGPVRMGPPAGPMPGAMAGPPSPGWHGGLDDEDDFFDEPQGPDLYVRQALDRLEASAREHRASLDAQRQVLDQLKRDAILEMVQKLAAEGYLVDPKVDVPDLAREPTPQAREKKVEFMRRTRARTAPKPTSPNVGMRPYRFGRGTSGVVADPGLGQTAEPSYAEIVEAAKRVRTAGVERPRVKR